MIWARDIAKDHIKWNINSGNSNFWWDSWSSLGPLAKIPQVNFEGNMENCHVKDFIRDGTWDEDKLAAILPRQIILYIIDTEIGDPNLIDDAIWNCSEDGQYSNKSAWHITRQSKNKDPFMSKIWHKTIPFKISFLSWRLCRGKLPFNEKLSKFGRQSNLD